MTSHGPPTCRQRTLLREVDRWLHKRGMAPTFQELADRLCVKKASAHELADYCIGKGLLTKTPSIGRSLRLTMLGERYARPHLANLQDAWLAASADERQAFRGWLERYGG